MGRGLTSSRSALTFMPPVTRTRVSLGKAKGAGKEGKRELGKKRTREVAHGAKKRVSCFFSLLQPTARPLLFPARWDTCAVPAGLPPCP